MAVITVDHLTKRFGEVVAVDDLSFQVEAGSVTAVIGPNGAGKTTTLRTLLGLVAPTSGTARVLGRRYVELRDPIRTIGALLEETSFHPGRRAVDHLRVVATAAGIPRERVGAVLEQVAMTEYARRRVGGYSLGMRQRLALAASLLGEPSILVLDEPANGLDPEGIRWLRGFLRHFAADGGTVLVSSHALAEVAQAADDVLVVDHGRVVAHAPLAELTAGSAARVRVRTPDPGRLGERLAAVGATVEPRADGELLVGGASAAEVGDAALALQVAIHGLVEERSTLEEIFFELTAGADGEER